MELATLDVSGQQAAEAVIHYRRALKLHRNAEDEAILRGYNQVLKGRKLIQIDEVIREGGADGLHRPKLAIARADYETCDVTAWPNGRVHFGNWHWRSQKCPRGFRFPEGTMPRWAATREWDSVSARAIVPIIPPQHRPTGDLAGYYILWEAEWQAAPRDPALLKFLGGRLFAVLAMWDLTDLERAVLAGRSAS